MTKESLDESCTSGLMGRKEERARAVTLFGSWGGAGGATKMPLVESEVLVIRALI